MTGKPQLISHWPRVLGQVRDGAEDGLKLSGEKMQYEVIGELYATKSGHTYSRDGRIHQASAPGESPASDFKKLEGSIRVNRDGALITAVSANTPYALALEFGDAHILPRPMWITVALELGGNGGQVVQIIGNQIRGRLR